MVRFVMNDLALFGSFAFRFFLALVVFLLALGNDTWLGVAGFGVAGLMVLLAFARVREVFFN